MPTLLPLGSYYYPSTLSTPELAINSVVYYVISSSQPVFLYMKIDIHIVLKLPVLGVKSRQVSETRYVHVLKEMTLESVFDILNEDSKCT